MRGLPRVWCAAPGVILGSLGIGYEIQPGLCRVTDPDHAQHVCGAGV